MKVVFLDTTLDGTLIGGAHTFLHKIFGGLRKKNIELHFITKGKPLAKTAVNIENSGAIFHNHLWPYSAFVEESAPILACWLNELNPDVYIVSVSPDIGWAVLPLLLPSIATIAIGHNDSETFYEPARHYAPFLTKVIGVSSEICHNYHVKSGIQKDKITWIPYGVEGSDLEPQSLYESGKAPLSLVYVGRLEDEQKRASDLIKITQSLVNEAVDFRFNIIGDGVLFETIKEELSNEISKGVVHLTGWLDSEPLMEYLRNSDIFVLTSAYEGFCISLIEAMANGCCPIVTDIKSGNNELVSNEENGFIVPVGDFKAFVERIKMLQVDFEKLLILRQNAWKVGNKYSVSRMVDSYCDFFHIAASEIQKNPRQSDNKFPLMESCRSRYPLWMRRIKKLINSKKKAL